MTKILLFGAGGVGSFYCYVLDKAGAEVTAVCRSNYDSVAEHGFRISSTKFGELAVKPKVVRNASEAAAETFDYVVVCSKVTVGRNPSTSDLIRPVVGSATAIVVAQNGIGIDAEYAEAFPQNPVIPASVYLQVTEDSPGKVSMGPIELLEIGSYSKPANAASFTAIATFAELFNRGGGTCKISDDIQCRRWVKLFSNAAWNPACALTRLSANNLLNLSPRSEALIRGVMLEVLSVAHAKGFDVITEKDIEWHLERPRANTAANTKEPSMLTDVRMGRPLEVEAIIGNLVRMAEEIGVAVPKCEVVYTLVAALNHSIELGRQAAAAE